MTRIATKVRQGLAALLLGLFCAAALLPQEASAAEDFYKGKQITIYVSGSGSYDAYARYLAKYMPKYIPGEPTIIVKNMSGASGLKATNYIYNAAAKDGTEIAGTHGHIPTLPLFSSQGIEYDPTKLSWIGSVTKEIFLGYVWRTSPVQSMEEARAKEMVVGGQALGSMSIDIPLLANAMMGTKFKIISGYGGSSETRLAMERGETHGVFGTSWSSLMTGKPEWVKDKTIKVIVQFGEKPHPDLPGVPSLYDFIIDMEDREALKTFLARQETGKPYFAPPGVPADRLAILRRAFDAVVKDPAFLAEADKAHLEVVDPMSGKDMEEYVARMSKMPAAYAQRINEIFERFSANKVSAK